MDKIVLFPRRKELPKTLQKQLEKSAKEYTEALFAALHLLAGEDSTKEELDEVSKLVNKTYADAIDKAIEEIEGKS